MKVTATFNIRRYWLHKNTPADVLATLNVRKSRLNLDGKFYLEAPYVDINYWGEGDRAITLMELRYADWILSREMITYNVEGDDGLDG
jgi:hypothetical protein